MGVYTRFKRNPEGFRQLVELLETTPSARRQKMIDVGMAEDAHFTEQAMKFMLTFEDIMALPDLEMAELMVAAPPRMIGYAISQCAEDVKMRFLKNAKPMIMAEVKDYMGAKVGPREIGGARLKLIEVARQLERRNLIRTKKIPILSVFVIGAEDGVPELARERADLVEIVPHRALIALRSFEGFHFPLFLVVMERGEGRVEPLGLENAEVLLPVQLNGFAHAAKLAKPRPCGKMRARGSGFVSKGKILGQAGDSGVDPRSFGLRDPEKPKAERGRGGSRFGRRSTSR